MQGRSSHFKGTPPPWDHPLRQQDGGWNRGPAPRFQGAAATHVGVPISKDLVKHVAELPAEDGAAGKWQADGIGPESEGPLLMVSAQNDAYQGQGQVQEAEAQVWGRSGCSASTTEQVTTGIYIEGWPLTPQPPNAFSPHPFPATVHQEL